MKNNGTADIVRNIISNNATLQDYLQRDLLNATQLARELLPIVKKENKKATVESIFVAIKRMNLKKQKLSADLKNCLDNLQILMRNDVSLFCLQKGGGADIRSFKTDDIFFVNHGTNEVTVVIDRKNKKLIKGKIILEKQNLAIVILRSTLELSQKSYRQVPGYVNFFLNNIAREGINIEDIISTYSQVTLVVEEKYLSKVYDICTKIKKGSFL